MKFSRASGVLLHPTSFPGPGGIGTLGKEARDFLDFLICAKQQLWQIMPLGPTGYGDSPYQCFSAFAGNPLLIALDPQECSAQLPADHVDFGPLIQFKIPALHRAYEKWNEEADEVDRVRFDRFLQENETWLDDYAHFMALKDLHGGLPWNMWPADVAFRKPAALSESRQQLKDQIRTQSWFQFQFFSQWAELRSYANINGIKIIGDIPIFIAYDSSDVWANPELFYLDEKGDPTVVAGVPPDYFSVTGQRWGNPHYRWDLMAKDGYRWWIERFRHTLKLVDIMRIDHFRGFEAYWEVPATEETAIKGRWVKGPGIDLFRCVEKALGNLPIIAEDLGLITPEVIELRDEAGYPGMRVLQFGFGSGGDGDGGSDDPFLPHNYIENTVAYTGTHDNNTAEGWFLSAPENEVEAFLKYSGRPDRPVHEEMIRLVMKSIADTVIIPLQDILGLGPEARINTPGTAAGNWSWRYRSEDLTEELAVKLAEITVRTGRA